MNFAARLCRFASDAAFSVHPAAGEREPLRVAGELSRLIHFVYTVLPEDQAGRAAMKLNLLIQAAEAERWARVEAIINELICMM